MRASEHLINPEIIKLARARMASVARPQRGQIKRGFVPGGDPTMTGGAPPGGGGPPPPGGDPSGGGGMPPPGMPPPGMDPSGGGGMPPPGMDPSMGMPPPPPDGGGGGDPAMTAKLDQILQALQGGAGAGAGQSGANQAGMLKPKIDVNVEIMQIKHMLAKIIDAMGIPVKAQEMVATPEKLTQMASQQQGSGQQDASMGGGPGAIPPIPPMDGSGAPGGGGGGMPKAGSYRERGAAFTYDAAAMEAVGNKAAAIARFRKQGSAASAPANGRAARDADPFDDRRSGRQRPR